MFRFQIIIEYDGTGYVGWQSQKNGKSVQKEIEKILSKILKIKIKVISAGRTDAGVHSTNQSAHFDIKNNLISYSDYNENTKYEYLLDILKSNKDIADDKTQQNSITEKESEKNKKLKKEAEAKEAPAQQQKPAE